MHSHFVKTKALKLRLEGNSFNQISAELKLAKSTLYGWLATVQLSEKSQLKIAARTREGSQRGLIKRNQQQTHLAIQRSREAMIQAKKRISKLSSSELLLVGAALYWGEGYKRKKIVRGRERTEHPISLSNSDPGIIAVFLKFLRECLQITDNRITIGVHFYEHNNPDTAIRYWMKVTQLPQENFRKVYCGVSHASLGKKPYNRLPHGTIQVRVNSTPLFYTILGLIEGLKEQTIPAGIV